MHAATHVVADVVRLGEPVGRAQAATLGPQAAALLVEGLGGVALPEYARQTVEKQSLDIDVMTGVTVTLDAYKEAVNDALSKAL